MSKRGDKISEQIIDSVKSLLNSKSQRMIADELRISQYTVWCISKGKYDTQIPLQHDRIVKDSYFRHF